MFLKLSNLGLWIIMNVLISYLKRLLLFYYFAKNVCESLLEAIVVTTEFLLAETF